MSFLQVQGLKKVFPGAGGKADAVVFDDVHFGIERGEFVCIIGHSGCGKTAWSSRATRSCRGSR